MSTKILTSLKWQLIDSVFALVGLAFLFCGLVAPLAFRTMLRVGEFPAFVLSTLLFTALCFLAVVRQRHFAHAERTSQQFVSLLALIWRRKLMAVVLSGFLLAGSILHGILVGTGVLESR